MKKKIAFLCTFACLMGTIEPTLATEYNSPTDDANVPVTFDMNSIFTVTLPENIQGKATTSVDFNYSVQGDIAANEVVTVEPQDSTFTLSDITDKTIDASVSIPKTEFSYDEIYTENVQTGSVSVNNLPAGRWEGVCKFLINLNTVNIEKSAGFYDAKGKLLCTLTAEQVEADYIVDNDLPTTLGIDKSQITEIIIPEGTTKIGNFAFNKCRDVSSVTIPDGVTTIGSYAFAVCPSLSSVTIPDGVTTIKSYAFDCCRGLTSVSIPDSVISIEKSAFAMCEKLSSLVIPNSVTSIGIHAFYDVPCVYYNGDAVGSPWSAKQVYTGWMEDAEGNILCGLTTEQVEAKYTKDNNLLTTLGIDKSQVTKVIIPKGTTSIGESAFYDCLNLTSVTVPDSISSIKGFVFENTPWLASKRAENPLVIVNDILIDGKTASGDITIPSNVKTITAYAFRDCTSLTSVTISDNVTLIGYESFAGCTNLVSITMSNNISTIGSRAFYDCASLNNVILPDNITTIGNSVFFGCSELNSIVIPDSVTSISGWAFCDCTKLTLTIPDSVSSIGTSAFSGVPHIYYNGTATGSPWGAKAIN